MRIAGKALLATVAIAAILYVFDYVAAKIPIPGSRQVYADVTIDQYYAVKEKGNSIEYMPANPFVERCVYSIFPHFGSNPCWYVMRHTRRAIEIGRTSTPALARGEDGGEVNVVRRGAAREIVGWLGETLQHRPDGDGAAQALSNLVADVAG